MSAPHTAQPDADGWIAWAGGECPVEPGVLVQVKWADPDRATLGAVPAETWSLPPYEWSKTAAHEIPRITIIAYRVVPA